MIKSFIYNLSSFYNKENDLSNVVWIMCESCPIFKELFVKFFFPDIKMEDIIEIRREQPDDNDAHSRVDFFIEMENDKPYLIEVKISDENHHFGQYEYAYHVTSDRLGYIVNYNLTKEGYDVKTWEQFHNYLSDKKDLTSEENELVSGFLSYLENVCNIIIIKEPMKISGIHSLYSLYSILFKLINRAESNYSYEPYSKTSHPKIGNIGMQYIEYVLKWDNKKLYCWLSIYFKDEKPELWIEIGDFSWEYNNQEFKKLYALGKTLPDGTHYNKAALYNGDIKRTYSFKLKDSDFDKMENSESIEEQITILKDFIDEVSKFLVSL